MPYSPLFYDAGSKVYFHVNRHKMFVLHTNTPLERKKKVTIDLFMEVVEKITSDEVVCE